MSQVDLDELSVAAKKFFSLGWYYRLNSAETGIVSKSEN